jgi:DNA helicase-2/ATP-dependent DNA helicase PcrA
MFGSTDYRPPSRFLDEIPAELMMAIGEEEKRGKGLGRHRDAVVAHAMRRQNAPADEHPAPAEPTGARGADQIGLRVGDDVSHERFGEGVIIDIEGAGDKAEAIVRFRGDAGEKRLLLVWAPLTRV